MPSPTGGSNRETQLLRRHRLALYRPFGRAKRREPRDSEGVVLDYNAAGRLVGIDIDEASKRVQMDKLVLSQLPSTVETAAA